MKSQLKTIAALSFASLALMMLALQSAAAGPRDTKPQAAPARVMTGARIIEGSKAQEIRLQINKSIIMELAADAKDILVSNPKIADAVVRSARKVFLVATEVGSTNIFFFDQNSQQIAAIELVVERDLDGLNRSLRKIFPNSSIRAEGVNQNVMLTGSVNSAADSQRAVDVANSFLAKEAGKASNSGSDNSGIVNALTILGKDQVQLRVIVAEMNRDAVKQLGIDLNGAQSGVREVQNAATGAITQNYYEANSFGLSNAAALTGAGGVAATFAAPMTQILGNLNTTATIKAMERVGIVKTLAEPTLTAISGEEANFLAGGQVPIPTPGSATSGPGVTYKDFGVALAFNPVVLAEGRISLHVKTEISEIDETVSVAVPGGSYPGFRTRRAETVLELPSGGSMVMAGLMRDVSSSTINGVPGLRKLPVLGRLFSSQKFTTQQSELVVIVTPYIVNPVARKDLSLPTDGYVNATEPDAVLFGRLNKMYGTTGAQVGPYHGRPGFIYQ